MTRIMFPFPPHSLRKIPCCDFCRHSNVLDLQEAPIGEAKTSLIGWHHCANEECLTLLKQAQSNWIYPKRILIREFSDNFVIQRTSGAMEKGWKVQDDGFRVKENVKDVYVTVFKDSKEKTVLLSDLRQWNPVRP
jgi:hypothetical protein